MSEEIKLIPIKLRLLEHLPKKDCLALEIHSENLFLLFFFFCKSTYHLSLPLSMAEQSQICECIFAMKSLISFVLLLKQGS